MGNIIVGGGRRRRAEIMRIDGETFKLKTPAKVRDVIKDYPGHVLLASEAVKHFGIRAKPLEPEQDLKPKKVYFLVEIPTVPEEKLPHRRVRSGIHMSAKDRLECLMLSRRTVSDLAVVRDPSGQVSDGPGPVRVKVRLPKAQVAKLMKESKDGAEVAQKIIDLYMGSSGDVDEVGHQKPGLPSIGENFKAPKRRVSFVEEAEIPFEVAP